MSCVTRPEPLRMLILPAGALPPLPPIFPPITCHELAARSGGRYSAVCKHSASLRCDLRVVGMTTYRIPG